MLVEQTAMVNLRESATRSGSNALINEEVSLFTRNLEFGLRDNLMLDLSKLDVGSGFGVLH